MSLFIASIASGSNGNCYYVGNEQDAILVDAGISCREVVRRMQRLNLSMHRVKAIFISHEHSDHIRGLYQLAKKYSLPVYITGQTLKNCPFRLPPELICSFKTNISVSIGGLTITGFDKAHDAIEPHSFVIDYKSVKVGVFTDIGRPCENLRYHFNQCHAAFLESNYDEDMLHRGRYPVHLKRRISGGEGHLSNKQAVQLFQNYAPPHMTHLILSHLSQENNSPNLVEKLFSAYAGERKIIVASRFNESEVYCIQNNKNEKPSMAFAMPSSLQMSLF